MDYRYRYVRKWFSQLRNFYSRIFDFDSMWFRWVGGIQTLCFLYFIYNNIISTIVDSRECDIWLQRC